MPLLPTIDVSLNLSPAAVVYGKGEDTQHDDSPSSISINITWGLRKKLRDEAVALGISTTQHATNIVKEALSEG